MVITCVTPNFSHCTAPTAGVIAIVWWLRPEVYNYSRVLSDSLLFLESHRVGAAVSLQPVCLWTCVGACHAGSVLRQSTATCVSTVSSSANVVLREALMHVDAPQARCRRTTAFRGAAAPSFPITLPAPRASSAATWTLATPLSSTVTPSPPPWRCWPGAWSTTRRRGSFPPHRPSIPCNRCSSQRNPKP